VEELDYKITQVIRLDFYG